MCVFHCKCVCLFVYLIACLFIGLFYGIRTRLLNIVIGPHDIIRGEESVTKVQGRRPLGKQRVWGGRRPSY